MIELQTTDQLTSWGRVLRPMHRVARPHWRDELVPAMQAAAADPGRALAVGLSRSYGDSELNPDGALVVMTGLDRIHAFDAETGVLRADAGLSLDALIRFALPRGWFPPVLPGTRFVTLGGAIANDVHGKNHHRAGTFGRHVRRLGLLRSDGTLHELAPGAGLFEATIGGLGLTGVIAWAEIQLSPVAGAWLDGEDVVFHCLDDFFTVADESEASHAYTVAWVDCLVGGRALGRGVFSRANPAPDLDRTLHGAPRLAAPLDAPAGLLNRFTLRNFNRAYFTLKALRQGRRRAHYDGFFFPLDAVGAWNRIYGRPGFFQYQCVLPPQAARRRLGAAFANHPKRARILPRRAEDLRRAAIPGLLSFPMKGATLALDFPNRGQETLDLLARLDDVVRESGGRLYPAKDGRISAAMFAAGYPRLAEFARHVDPNFASGFWRRVAP